ncbi:MAG TPA: GAF domain-containing protein, partial [Campylobacterales bacterium]|nr:GAF domain-containing protein [Campylobacterales bacterium]
MKEHFKNTFKNLANNLNLYVASSDLKYIHDIEEILKAFFSAKYVRLWKYDKNNETLILLNESVEKVISLESSLTKQAINNQASIFINHISSNKHYNPDIDNPLGLKLKSLIILPSIKGNKVLGVLKIARGINERKVFTKQDKAILQKLVAIF